MPVLSAPTAPTHELPGARFTTLATPSRGCAETAVWTVELLPGADAVPHQVTREEIFVALAGEAAVVLDGAEHALREGDTLVVPAGVTFSLAAAGTTPSARSSACRSAARRRCPAASRSRRRGRPEHEG